MVWEVMWGGIVCPFVFCVFIDCVSAADELYNAQLLYRVKHFSFSFVCFVLFGFVSN
jgi:hypothetical protein